MQQSITQPEKLTRDFKRSEFLCPCGECDGGKMNPYFMDKLQYMRDYCGFPFKILSGFRCAKHNASAAVGGKPDSQHLKGNAADIVYENGVELYSIIAAAIRFGMRGIGVNNGSIHVDTRDGAYIAFTYYKKN